ncbi:unnamed protein product [Brachionus calyciflorus]|uniref:Uncharacterized protein n=1 Tax=Brachionus calyciflorus TaxID=104777 RepID=A0A814PA55_9BILA|nr:unnamed protein product [Brachionus calyciflorus]
MDDLVISLPCGFTTPYKCLKNEPNEIDCPVCKDHKINIKECLDIKRNKFIINQRGLELRMNIFDILKKDLISKKEDFKLEIRKNSDDTIKSKTSNIELNFDQKLQEIEHYEILNFAKHSDMTSKIEELANNLDRIQKLTESVKKLLTDPNQGEKIEFIFSNNFKYNLGEMFGLIKPQDNVQYKEIRKLVGHSSSIFCIKSIGQDKLLSGSSDKTIKLWDKNTGECLRTYHGHTNSIYTLCLVNYEKFLSGSSDTTIKYWNINTSECLKTINAHEGYIYDVKLLNNKKFFSVSWDKSIKIWKLKKLEFLKSIKMGAGILSAEKFDNKVIVGLNDGLIKILDIEKECVIKTLTGHTSYVFCLKLINKTTLASRSNDNSVKIWNIDSGNCLEETKGHSSTFNSLAVSCEDKLFIGFNDGNIKLWNKEKNTILDIIKGINNQICALDINNNGELFASTIDKTIIIFKPC